MFDGFGVGGVDEVGVFLVGVVNDVWCVVAGHGLSSFLTHFGQHITYIFDSAIRWKS